MLTSKIITTVQRLALEPFRYLTGAERVTISGAVEPGYGRDIRECMESQIHWMRGISLSSS